MKKFHNLQKNYFTNKNKNLQFDTIPIKTMEFL